MSGRIQMIERTLDILEALAEKENGLILTDVAEETNLPKSTTHRILNALMYRNYVVKNEETNRYKLGLKIVNLASNMLYSIDLRAEAYPFLQSLADETRQTIHLAVWQDGRAIYLDKIEAYQRLAISSRLGKVVEWHCTGLGKILLAYADSDKQRKIVDEIDFVKHTERTNTDPAVLLKELHEVRQQGFATDVEEHEEGIYCVAVPVFDYTNRVVAAISITGTVDFFQGDQKEKILSKMKSVALSLSSKMGFQGTEFPK